MCVEADGWFARQVETAVVFSKLRVCLVACVVLAASVGVGLPAEAQAASWDASVASSSPSHWWSLDDTSAGGTAADSAGSLNGAHGPDALATVGIDGSAGVFGPGGAEGLSLDGSVTDFPQVSAELWFKPDPATAVTDHQRLIRHRTHGYNIDWSPSLGAVTAGVVLSDPNGDEWDSIDLVAVGVDPTEWHHVVLVVSTVKVSLWVDGNERDTFEFSATNATGVLYTGDSLTIGTDSLGPGDTRQFSGAIDEVVLYDRALAGSEVQAHFTSTGRSIEPFVASLNGSAYAASVVNSGPIAYWQLDDAAGSTIVEDSIDPGSNNSSVTASPTFGVPGIFDDSTAVSLDNRSETVALPGSLLASLGNEVTVEFWFNTSQTYDVGRVMRARSHGFGIDWAGGTQLLHAWVQTPSGSASVVTEPLSLNQWHHVAMVFDGTELRLVVNGVLEDVVASPASTITYSGTPQLTLGNDRPGTKKRNLVGTVDEVAVYDTALSTAEIASHYTASGRMAPIPLATSEAVEACISYGGNVFLPEPTVAELNGEIRTYTAGCYYWDDCSPTFTGWAGNFQDWVCENQTELVLALAASAFAIPAAIVCSASGACAAVAVAAAGQGGSVSVGTAATAAGALVIAQGVLTLATASDTTEAPVFVTVDNKTAPHPGQIKRNAESNEPIFIEPEFLDEDGFYLDDPEEAPQYCPDGSKRPGALMPPLGEGRWSHIVDRHFHIYADSPDDSGGPDQFSTPYNVDDYPLDFTVSDEIMAKELVMSLLYATFCWGDPTPNPNTTLGGQLYDLVFPTDVGFGPDKSTSVEGDQVNIDRIRVVVIGTGEIYTAFPVNPTK